ncbi:MAG: cytochrome c maturation protein CcmE [Veillonellales bacterium]
MTKQHTISLFIIFSFLIFCAVTYTHSLSPYVSFAEARTTKGTVQVKGTLSADNIAYLPESNQLRFRLRDDAGEEALIVYTGTKPEGLEHTASIVAIGRYQNNQFAADKLLIKCPSKYQRSVNR